SRSVPGRMPAAGLGRGDDALPAHDLAGDRAGGLRKPPARRPPRTPRIHQPRRNSAPQNRRGARRPELRARRRRDRSQSLEGRRNARSRGRELKSNRRRTMKIAQVSPLYESVPPEQYGGTERVVSYLTEELVGRGHQVTLFASGDSITNA